MSTTQQPARRSRRARHQGTGSAIARAPDGGGGVAGAATVGERTYRQIRADIVTGRLTPGRKLTLDRMRHTYGASVSTLRELMSGLASEGLLLAHESRGFQVPEVSSANLREIAAMRLLLEGHAMRESFARGDVEWEGRVVAAHHVLASAETRLSAGEAVPSEVWRRYDWGFHHALISCCASSVLLDMYASICDKFLRYQMVASVFRGRVAADEHHMLLECALARDWARAQKTLATHVEDCVAQMAPVIDAKASSIRAPRKRARA